MMKVLTNVIWKSFCNKFVSHQQFGMDVYTLPPISKEYNQQQTVDGKGIALHMYKIIQKTSLI